MTPKKGWILLAVMIALTISQLVWIIVTLTATIKHNVSHLQSMVPRPAFPKDLYLDTFSKAASVNSISQFSIHQLSEHLRAALNYHYPKKAFILEVAQDSIKNSVYKNGNPAEYKKHLQENVASDYERRYHRKPPRYFSIWLEVALSHNVTIDLTHYDQIQKDFDVFRVPRKEMGSSTSGITLDDIDNLKLLDEVHFLEIFESNTKDKFPIKINGHALQAMPAFEPLLVRTLKLGRELNILPSNYFAIVMNARDEPRSLPTNNFQYQTNYNFMGVDNTKKAKSILFYQNPHELLRDNKCMNELYVRSKHPITSEPLSAWHPSIASFAMSFPTTTRLSLPIFSDCKLPCHSDILIPRTEYRQYNKLLFLKDSDADQSGSLSVNAAKSMPLPSWEDRKNTLFFRGGSAATFPELNVNLSNPQWRKDARYIGWTQDKDKWRWNNRLTLYRWAREMKKTEWLKIDIDVNITDTVDRENYIGKNEFVSEEIVQSKYRYLLVPDGNTWPSRFRRHLSLGAVVLYHSLYLTWWNFRIHPFQQYLPIPIERTLQGLTDILFWLQSHPQEAEKLAQDGRASALTRMRDIDMELYTLLAFMEYAELCRYCKW